MYLRNLSIVKYKCCDICYSPRETLGECTSDTNGMAQKMLICVDCASHVASEIKHDTPLKRLIHILKIMLKLSCAGAIFTLGCVLIASGTLKDIDATTWFLPASLIVGAYFLVEISWKNFKYL